MLYLLLQSSSPLQWQNNVQLCQFALQLHLSVAHCVSLLKPDFKSLSSSAGARGLSEGMIVGERAALPSGWDQPCSVGSRAGGSVLRQSRQMATADNLSECCLSWKSIWNMLITCSKNLHPSPRRIRVELRSTHQAHHAGAEMEGVVSFYHCRGLSHFPPLKQMGLDISALLKRGIVFGTSYFECVSIVAMSRVDGHQPIGAAQFSIKIVDYDLNKSFHCMGCRRSLLIWGYVATAEDFLKRSNSSYEQQTR